ncbi:MAG: hypothetical protein E7256_01620 [Lachnospiraceae bacterium]|nr:hypothetical protein [Lachnospiraceae bacterium]
MTDAMLVNLMSGLDLSYLENDYLEEDLRQNRAIKSRKLLNRIGGLKEGSEFVIKDSLQDGIEQEIGWQSEIQEKEGSLYTDLSEKLEIKVDHVKKRISRIRAIVTGILTMAVVAVSVVAIILKKKSSAKLLKKVERARTPQSAI